MNIIEMQNVTAQRRDKIVFEHVDWTLRPHENWAIIGKTGAGKTSFIDLIMGKMTIRAGSITFPVFHSNAMQEKGYFRLANYVAVVRFNVSLIDYKRFYYQQRYFSSENEGVQTVKDFLNTNDENLFKLLNINDLLDLELNKLSNGQTRKMYLAKALLRKPQLLILDNPFLGLDVQARLVLNDIIKKLITEGYHIIVICNYAHEVPAGIRKRLRIDNFKVKEVIEEDVLNGEIAENMTSKCPQPNNFTEGVRFDKDYFPKPPVSDFQNAICLKNVKVRYGEKVVLDKINWQVKRGDKWALTGSNGSGKSTLLSLVYGDHPQAYSNEVYVFDRKRGDGVSIWEIKSRIGYVSPELHLYFSKHIANFTLVTEGVAERTEFANRLFEFYNIEKLKKQDFQQTSMGEQRLILLLKALVQNPEFLILDEPFQGMDVTVMEKSKQLIDDFCENRTLIFVTHYTEEIPSSIKKFMRLNEYKLINKTINYL